MNNIHILVVVRLGFKSGDYLGFGGARLRLSGGYFRVRRWYIMEWF
jgi:hypothetical protein